MAVEADVEVVDEVLPCTAVEKRLPASGDALQFDSSL